MARHAKRKARPHLNATIVVIVVCIEGLYLRSRVLTARSIPDVINEEFEHKRVDGAQETTEGAYEDGEPRQSCAPITLSNELGDPRRKATSIGHIVALLVFLAPYGCALVSGFESELGRAQRDRSAEGDPARAHRACGTERRVAGCTTRD